MANMLEEDLSAGCKAQSRQRSKFLQNSGASRSGFWFSLLKRKEQAMMFRSELRKDCGVSRGSHLIQTASSCLENSCSHLGTFVSAGTFYHGKKWSSCWKNRPDPAPTEANVKAQVDIPSNLTSSLKHEWGDLVNHVRGELLCMDHAGSHFWSSLPSLVMLPHQNTQHTWH